MNSDQTFTDANSNKLTIGFQIWKDQAGYNFESKQASSMIYLSEKRVKQIVRALQKAEGPKRLAKYIYSYRLVQIESNSNS